MRGSPGGWGDIMTIGRKVDPVILANHREQIAGHVPVKSLTRLSNLLQSSDGDVQVSVVFEPGADDHPVIEGEVKAAVSAMCQRCLKAMPLEIETEFRLVVLNLDTEVDETTGLFDSVLMENDEIDLYDLVEDELLMAMPLSPMHSANDDCAVSGKYRSDIDVQQSSAAETQRPFKDLGKLFAE